jgi:hypothetical protein
MRRHESQRQTHKHRNNASPIPKEQMPQKAQKGEKGLELRRKRQPPTTRQRTKASGGGPPTPQAQETMGQTPPMRRRRSEDVARLSATRRLSRPGRRTTPQQPCREKRGDHHSPMKHSKRRMFGTHGQGQRHAPYLLKAGLPACYLVEQQEERARRTEMREVPAPIQRRDVTQSRQPHETDEMSGTAMG